MPPSPGRGRKRPIGCIVLQRLYGAQKLETLHGCMLRLASHAPEAHASLQQGLLRPDDPPSYRELLTNGVVAMSDSAPALPAHLTLHQACSQAEVRLTHRMQASHVSNAIYCIDHMELPATCDGVMRHNSKHAFPSALQPKRCMLHGSLACSLEAMLRRVLCWMQGAVQFLVCQLVVPHPHSSQHLEKCSHSTATWSAMNTEPRMSR